MCWFRFLVEICVIGYLKWWCYPYYLHLDVTFCIIECDYVTNSLQNSSGYMIRFDFFQLLQTIILISFICYIPAFHYNICMPVHLTNTYSLIIFNWTFYNSLRFCLWNKTTSFNLKLTDLDVFGILDPQCYSTL